MELHAYVKNSEQILNYLPGYLSITDLEGNLAWLNNRATASLGLNSIGKAIGKKYFEVERGFEKSPLIKAENDRLLFSANKNMSFLGYHEYVNGWRMSLCERSLVYNEKK